MRFKWAEKDVEYLKKHYGHTSSKDLGEYFGVSSQAVRDKARKLGLKAKEIRCEYWSEKEEKILLEHFEYGPKNYLLELLPNRTWQSIVQRGRNTLKMSRKTQDRLKLNYNFFEDWTEESSYVYGFIMADGYLILDHGESNATSLQIDIASRDEDILHKILEVMECEATVKHSKRESSRIFISNRKIALDLIDKGLPSIDKTNTAKWPADIPEEMIRHFVRGYFDGDGSICFSECVRVNFIGTEGIIEGIRNSVPSGKNNKITIAKRGNEIQRKISFGGKTAYKILNWMYQDASIYLNRKHEKFQELCETSQVAELKPRELLKG